jgi:pimeloyl-ACP methyl ester carboxylesterase
MDTAAEVFSEKAMPVAKRFLLICAAALSLGLVSLAAAPKSAGSYKTERGEINGAQFIWLRPPNWNQRVLLLAHDQRPPANQLTAQLKADDPVFAGFLQDGWLVATTSYRRNGLILVDAVADLDALRAEIERKNGPLDRVIVEGDGMGGVIALLLAEREPENPPLYQGVVASDPIFQIREEGGSGITLQPKIPVVFLSTRREYLAAEKYADAKIPKSVRPFTPALLRVNRDGLGNLNAAEKSFALQTLDRWLDQGGPEVTKTDPTKAYVDATIAPDERPSRVIFDSDGRSFTAHVVNVITPRGDILLDAQPSDFTAIGIGTNAFFRVQSGAHAFRVRFDKDQSTVKRGDWVAFVDANGFYYLSRHQLSAAATMRVEVGDEVRIDAYPHAKADSPAGEINEGKEP